MRSTIKHKDVLYLIFTNPFQLSPSIFDILRSRHISGITSWFQQFLILVALHFHFLCGWPPQLRFWPLTQLPLNPSRLRQWVAHYSFHPVPAYGHRYVCNAYIFHNPFRNKSKKPTKPKTIQSMDTSRPPIYVKLSPWWSWIACQLAHEWHLTNYVRVSIWLSLKIRL